jgi:hypothetical protein
MTARGGRWKLVGAVVLGAALASLPFLQFGLGDDHSHSQRAHADHSAWHGGRLAMVGDHHIEIVESSDQLRVFTSDAFRRPLRPTAGTLRVDGGPPILLQWRSSYLVAERSSARRAADLAIELKDGVVLELRIAADSPSSTRRVEAEIE